MNGESYDLIVIGAGQAGPFLAAKMVEHGWKVALIEERELGGTCVNRGCTPTKTLRKSARVAHMARRARDFGIEVADVKVDFNAAMERMRDRVAQARTGLENWLDALEGLTVVKAWGRLAGKEDGRFVVHAGERVLRAPRVVLNTGTRPFVPPIPGLTHQPHLDNESLLALDALPRKLVIVGGGYIALEMGQIFRRLGSKVAIVETGPRLTAREDPDVSAAIAETLAAEGIEIHTGIAIERVAAGESEGGVCLHLADGNIVGGSHLLVATGRVPNTDGIGLDTVGLSICDRGYLQTDGMLQTSAPGIWALGDINMRGAFTHTSYHDHEVLAHNWRFPQQAARSVDERTPIYAMFTDPPLGHVGLHEADAERLAGQGRRISRANFRMRDVSRAKEEDETQGLIKLLIDEDSGRFLGATVFGIGGDEVVQIIGQSMAAGGTWRQLRDALPVHPTVAEFLPTIIDARTLIDGGAG